MNKIISTQGTQSPQRKDEWRYNRFANFVSSVFFVAKKTNFRWMASAILGVLALGVVGVGCQTTETTSGAENATLAVEQPTATNAAPVKAGLYCGLGSRGANFLYWGKILKYSPDVELTYLDGEDLQNGKLDGLDILVMPGGSSKKQYASMEEEGAEAIRRFVRGGGKYFGTCAGLSLLLEETNRVALLPYRRIDGYYARGGGDVKVEFNEEWMGKLAITNANWSIRFHDGPVVTATNDIADVRAEVMALCRNAVDEHRKKPAEQRDAMIGTPAFIYATCGKGEIIACNCHPEGKKTTRELLSAVFDRLVGRRITIPDFESLPKGHKFKADGTKETLKKAVEMLK